MRMPTCLARLVLVLGCCLAAPLSAQESWEYTAYDIQTWIAFADAPELTPQVQADLQQDLIDQAWVRAGATWSVTPQEAPASLYGTILNQIDLVDVETVEAIDKEKFTAADKIMLVAVTGHHGQFEVVARELDTRSRVFGRIARKQAKNARLLKSTLVDAVVAAFSPLARIETSEGNTARIRVRAGGLITSEDSPSFVGKDTIMQPVIRRNDRVGNPKVIEVVEWTYLRVDAIDESTGNLWDCEVATALRNPLSGRGSARSLKFALGQKPTGTTTQLRLVSLQKRKQRDDTEITVEVPLEGYEIFAKSPLPPKEGEKLSTERIGRTDWRGIIEIEKTENYPMRLIYVKNGNFLLAKLPIIPGLDEDVTTDLTSDDTRLQVEAFVKGMESMVMDVVARRNILAARVRRQLQKGDIQQTRETMEEFANIASRDDLQRMISARRASVSSPSAREQRRIGALLQGIETLLARFLDNDVQGELLAEMRAAGVDFAKEEGDATDGDAGESEAESNGKNAKGKNSKGKNTKAKKNAGKQGKKKANG